MTYNDDGAVLWYHQVFRGAPTAGHARLDAQLQRRAGLQQYHNKCDFAIRMQQFFDHYLKDVPAPVWMEDGVPVIMKGKTLEPASAEPAVPEPAGSN